MSEIFITHNAVFTEVMETHWPGNVWASEGNEFIYPCATYSLAFYEQFVLPDQCSNI